MTNIATKAGRKVPEITAIFWATKLLTTAMGEATSDFLANTISPYAAVAIGFVVFAAALFIQFKAKRYIPWVYWLAVAMVAVFGTMAADVLHKQFGVPYVASTTFFAICLAVIFTVWQKVERSLSIHSITTTRREIFYWLTVMATFALGTAAGDWTANSLGLGYLSSGIVFTALMIIPILCRRFKFYANLLTQRLTFLGSHRYRSQSDNESYALLLDEFSRL